MLLINHEDNDRPIIFVHVRKNAGRSIKFWFCRRIKPNIISVLDYSKLDNGFLHATNMNGAINILRTKQYDKLPITTFAVKRNPYTRFISGWYYITRHPNSKNKEMDLDTFLERPLLKTFGKSAGHDWRHSWATQTDFLYKEGKLAVDYLLSFENLHEDFKNFRKKMNMDGGNLPFENRQKYKVTLTENQKNKIYDFFHEDFKNFGYEK